MGGHEGGRAAGWAYLDLCWMAGFPSMSGKRSVHTPYSFFCI